MNPPRNDELSEIIPGRFHTLRVLDRKPQGAYLEGDEVDPRILLPTREVPEGVEEGDEVTVFLYFDSEDRIIATTRQPKVLLGEFAWLKVVSTTSFGAFMDWGLPKDLLVPNGEQEVPMRQGRSCLIKVKKDRQSDLLIGSSKEKYFFEPWNTVGYGSGDSVSLLPFRRSPLGVYCLIGNEATGLLYDDEYPGELTLGTRIDGWIKEVRSDGKIDLQIRADELSDKKALSDSILQALQEGDGFLPLHDRSSPEEIHARFRVSKKKFRKAISLLYKARKITLEDDGIRQA